MKLKMVGLGKMGFNLALNMKDHEVDVEGFDVNEEARKKAEESGIKSYETLKDLVSADQKDVIWVMLPAGKITNSVLDELSGLCKKDEHRDRWWKFRSSRQLKDSKEDGRERNLFL